MQRCLQLAALSAGKVAPNPMVGAILVFEGRIIGEGYHQQYGEAHAEVNCINSVAADDKELINNSTMYVSLEPCAHFGKTPPCADLIVRHKIPKVIIGCKDSFAEVDGKGIKILQDAGIEVIQGILENKCIDLNKRFVTFYEKQRPYIILKWAQTADIKIASLSTAPAGRLLISNEITNRLVHRWRSEEASILVGTNTALRDDPSLTTRLWPGTNPVRMVIDKELKLPVDLKLFNGSAKTIIFNYLKQEESEKLSYHQLNKEEEILQQILAKLYTLQIQSVMVEGGSKLLQAFIDADLWDEARIITNTEMIAGKGLNAPVLINSFVVSEQKLKNDKLVVLRRR